MSSRHSISLAGAGILSASLAGALAGCDPGTTDAPAGAKDSRTFMMTVVQPPTQVLWDFGYAEKMSDDDWAKVSRAATDLVGAVPTITAGGITAEEKARAQSAQWQDWSMKTATAAAAAKRAADTKNQMELATAGDQLVEICSGCHAAFDPAAQDPAAPPPP